MLAGAERPRRGDDADRDMVPPFTELGPIPFVGIRSHIRRSSSSPSLYQPLFGPLYSCSLNGDGVHDDHSSPVLGVTLSDVTRRTEPACIIIGLIHRRGRLVRCCGSQLMHYFD